jgi:protease YdgD
MPNVPINLAHKLSKLSDRWSPTMPACTALLALSAAFVWTAGSATAETFKTRPHYGIIGEDNRKIVSGSEAAWTAVGHVNVTGYHSSAQCTGTRVAPGLVLTAAHCVVDHARKKVFPANSIHFLAGVDRDTSVGQAVAACVLLPEDFDVNAKSRTLPDMGVEMASVRSLRRDLALIVLKIDTSKAGLISIGSQSLREGQSLFHVGYHRDRRHKLMGDRTCKVLEQPDDLITTDCDAVAGGSGGPLLVEENGAWRIAAVMVAASENATFAVPLTAWPGMMEKHECP